MIWPYAFGIEKTRDPAIIDNWLPDRAFMLEHHSIDLTVSPARAFPAATDLSLRALPLVRALFSLRGIPYRGDMTLREMFSTRPFVLLEEEQGRELVFGVVGPFWSIHGGSMPPGVPRSPEEFREAMKTGRMAAIGNFRVEPLPGGSRVWTETWASTPEILSAALFSAYWLAVGPWSAWIRRMFLDAARERVREGSV